MIDLNVIVSSSAEEFSALELVTKGNSKIGKTARAFSIPAIDTCPGSTELCRNLCYAVRANSFFVQQNVQSAYWKNLVLTQRSDFARIMVKRLLKLGSIDMRWHVSGDIYDEVYAGKLVEIMSSTPDVRHWIYTRSWSKPQIAIILEKMAKLGNVGLWFSCDRETGEPLHMPNVRRAYLQISHEDVAGYKVDLYFREKDLQNLIVKKISGTLVCPKENGITHNTDCQHCRFCLNPKKIVEA